MEFVNSPTDIHVLRTERPRLATVSPANQYETGPDTDATLRMTYFDVFGVTGWTTFSSVQIICCKRDTSLSHTVYFNPKVLWRLKDT